jgi:hypothetical protein
MATVRVFQGGLTVNLPPSGFPLSLKYKAIEAEYEGLISKGEN